MLSNLIDILIVTPVIFPWLRGRELRRPYWDGVPGIESANGIAFPNILACINDKSPV